MSVSAVLVTAAAVCVIWAVVAGVLMTAALDRRGVKTPFPFIGLFMFRNLALYRDTTMKETGAVGRLFYHYVVPINAAWVLVLAALVTRAFA